jgi:hypothetical protein
MDLGSFIEFDGRPAVRFERTYDYAVERVWAAITEPGELAHWFPSSVELEPRAGGRISFSADPHASRQTGVVLAFDVLADRSTAARNAAGWDVCLDELAKLLAGRTGGGPHAESATPWQPRYDAYVATGMPSGADIPTAR